MNPLLHPWRISTLAVGTLLLIVGAYFVEAPDWDVPVSLLMAGATYLTAGWSMRAILDRRWALMPVVVLYAWISVDGVYALYWGLQNPIALDYMRDANWPVSLPLWGICGALWLFPTQEVPNHAIRSPPETRASAAGARL